MILHRVRRRLLKNKQKGGEKKLTSMTCGRKQRCAEETGPGVTLLWWDYSEGGSKCQAHCLNFDRGKIVVKISREFPYKEVHVTF